MSKSVYSTSKTSIQRVLTLSTDSCLFEGSKRRQRLIDIAYESRHHGNAMFDFGFILFTRIKAYGKSPIMDIMECQVLRSIFASLILGSCDCCVACGQVLREAYIIRSAHKRVLLSPTLIEMADDRQKTAKESKGIYDRLKKAVRLGSRSTPQSRLGQLLPRLRLFFCLHQLLSLQMFPCLQFLPHLL